MNRNNSQFPKNFLWGASTSSHQIEGNTNNQWSKWEKDNAKRLSLAAKNKWQDWQKEKFPEMFDFQNYISGRACDHYNFFREDFDLVAEGSHNAHRFSLEWSRIEPEEGKFNEKEIEHYRKVIKELKNRNIEPLACLWHWTNPLWLGDSPEANSKFSFYFSRYAKRMVEEFGRDVKFWITLNEPTSVIANCYTNGNWPPQKKNFFLSRRVYKILAESHEQAYKEIKKINKECEVGFGNILHFIEPRNPKSCLDKLVSKISDYFTNKKFLRMTNGSNDFLTAQYYFHDKIKFPLKIENDNENISDLGWEIYPEGIYQVLKYLQKYRLPIYITENGLADADDSKRTDFIREHLKWVKRAIDEGVDVRGYFYWSLLDNFEWDKGFWPRFGLIEVNFETLERKPRQSFWEYKKIIENNGIE